MVQLYNELMVELYNELMVQLYNELMMRMFWRFTRSFTKGYYCSSYPSRFSSRSDV